MTEQPSPRIARWLREQQAQIEQNRTFKSDYLLLPDGHTVGELRHAGTDVNVYCQEHFETSLDQLIANARQHFEIVTDAAAYLMGGIMRAIKLGEPAFLHEEGLLKVERDLLSCAQQDYADAKMQLGLLYCSAGKYFGHTEEEGLTWMLRAFNSNHSDAPSEIGNYYLRRENWEKAAKFLRKGDMRKCAMSAFRLAQMYHQGAGSIKQDVKKAFKLYGQASMRGYPEATVEMVELFLTDPETFPLRATPEELLREAIADGYPRAMFWLADMFENGQHAEQDLNEAVKLYQQAAEMGLAAAELKMGNIHDESHRDVFTAYKDAEQALHWYERAANNPENDEVRKRAFLALGDIGMKAEQYELAQRCFLNAVRFGSAMGQRLAAQAAHLHDAQQRAKGGK
ncbi:sel1 repeat family protein [Pseudomonas putida]|jgi:TPR repeat protein|uniref:tetratricopeptide repeat protein n=1 Tax=Pseudomonas putida group TaxID=136845 RepID=UPI001596B831|nr:MULTISPECIES: tetratricopeptide repeat protein [Pseudomonas putida group]MBI6941181.1 sel1 repeat family protein [Pseudomonas putida]MBI6957428.1 sel1 repeat family protein [Pseudomonas putida]MCZ9636687.1 sel1 repeat family protein [Pseudomonas putida]